MMGIFYKIIVVFTLIYTLVKSHGTVHLKRVHFYGIYGMHTDHTSIKLTTKNPDQVL